MQYLTYIRLAVVILSFIKQYRDAKAQGGEADVEAFVSMLSKLGEASGISELKTNEISIMAPEIVNLIKAVKALRVE